MARLKRTDTNDPGISRVRRGRGFGYVRPDGTPAGARVRKRVEELAIPPAWTDVWICTDPNGHIQATGHDKAGRKQYLYHERWRERRDRQKFEQMIEFGQALPKLRRRVGRDLGRRGLGRERVLACAVRLLDLGFFRIGGERYADENDTYGLATIRRKHLSFERGAAVFDYRAKGSQRHVQEVEDRKVVGVLRALKRRSGGGQELLAYRQGREWVDVKSDHVNEYLKDAVGGEFSAKDFRTWNATVLAAVSVAAGCEDGQPGTKAARKRITNGVVKRVAEYLSNTPAVCRSSYIDPRIFDQFDSGQILALNGSVDGLEPGQLPQRSRIERGVLELLS